MGVVSVPGGCQERQPISNQSGGQWLRQRSTLPFSEVLQRAVQRGLACIIKWERKPGPLNLPPNGDPSSITGAPLGGLYPKDPLSGSPLSPNCHWQIFFIGRKSCFPGLLALIHSSWLCSFKNSEGTPRVCRMSYLSSSRENRERSEEMHILHRVFLKAYNSLTYFQDWLVLLQGSLSPVWFIQTVIMLNYNETLPVWLLTLMNKLAL